MEMIHYQNFDIPGGNGVAICPSELCVQRISETIQNIRVIAEAIVVDQFTSGQCMLFVVFVFT